MIRRQTHLSKKRTTSLISQTGAGGDSIWLPLLTPNTRTILLRLRGKWFNRESGKQALEKDRADSHRHMSVKHKNRNEHVPLRTRTLSLGTNKQIRPLDQTIKFRVAQITKRANKLFSSLRYLFFLAQITFFLDQITFYFSLKKLFFSCSDNFFFLLR